MRPTIDRTGFHGGLHANMLGCRPCRYLRIALICSRRTLSLVWRQQRLSKVAVCPSNCWSNAPINIMLGSLEVLGPAPPDVVEVGPCLLPCSILQPLTSECVPGPAGIHPSCKHQTPRWTQADEPLPLPLRSDGETVKNALAQVYVMLTSWMGFHMHVAFEFRRNTRGASFQRTWILTVSSCRPICTVSPS